MVGVLVCVAFVWTTGSANRRAVDAILIVGGTVVEGTGVPRRKADVRIVGDTIREIGDLTPQAGERVIEAKGLIVAPGFIDTHSHADGGILEMPDAETQIRQGITTVVAGQDGGHPFPLRKKLDEIAQKPVAPNIAFFAGHGTLRREVMGQNYKRPAATGEILRMCALMEQEMEAGALGLSSGLEYDPGHYSTTAELIALAKVAAQHGGLYISHVRDESNQALKSFRELIEIAEKAKLPAQISHIKLGTTPVWGKAREVLKMMADARKQGLDITADVYPYLYWQSTITVLIPSREWDNRAVWQKGLAEVGGAKNVLLTTYEPDPTWQGKTLAQLAEQTGKDPVSLIQEIVQKTHRVSPERRESVVVTAMTEDDLRAFIADSHIMFCSDGGLRGTHPRGAGTYPRILGRYVREAKVLSLEEAIRKMTSLPAARMGFRERGAVQVGKKADIVLFDPETIRDTATTTNPTAPPVGLPTVLVNGVVVLDNGKITGEHPGAVLRH